MATTKAEWRSRLRPASYAGVGFSVSSADDAGGRAVVLHSIPGKKNPYPEDMGEADREIDIEAFIVGPDYMTRRDKLLEALNEEGPATLVHPYFGEITVSQRDKYRVKHGTTGGMCTITLALVRVDESQDAGATRNSRAGVTRAADGVQLDADSALNRDCTLLGVSSETLSSTCAGLRRVAATAQAVYRGDYAQALSLTGVGELFGNSGSGVVSAGLALSRGEYTAALSYASRITGMGTGGMVQAVGALGGLASFLMPLFSSSAILSAGSGASSGAARSDSQRTVAASLFSVAKAAPETAVPSFADAGGSVSGGTVPTPAAANLQAVATWQRVTATTEGCRVYAQITPATATEAAEMRETVLEHIDACAYALAENPTPQNDRIFAGLADLSAVTVAAIADNAAGSGIVLAVQSRVVMPSLVLAWRHVTRADGKTPLEEAEADLVARNGVPHPGFVPAGSLEVRRAS